MRKLALLLAGATAMALAACGDADETAAEDTTVIQTAPAQPAPAVTETTVVDRDSGGDSVTIRRDGVRVDVDSGGTRVRADIDDDPSITVGD